MKMSDNIISMCQQLNAKFVPITGADLDSERFITMLMQENKDFDAKEMLTFACALQKKYQVCTGGPNVIEEKMRRLLDNLSLLKNGGVDEYMRMELDLSRKRKILTILVPKVLSNNGFSSTQ